MDFVYGLNYNKSNKFTAPILISMVNLDTYLRIGKMNINPNYEEYGLDYNTSKPLGEAIKWLTEYATNLMYFDQFYNPANLFIYKTKFETKLEMPHIDIFGKHKDMFNNEAYLPLYLIAKDTTRTEVAYLFADRSIQLRKDYIY